MLNAFLYALKLNIIEVDNRYSLLWRETLIVRVKASLVIIPAELDAVLEVRAGAEHFPQVWVNIPSLAVVISLENLNKTALEKPDQS